MNVLRRRNDPTTSLHPSVTQTKCFPLNCDSLPLYHCLTKPLNLSSIYSLQVHCLIAFPLRHCKKEFPHISCCFNLLRNNRPLQSRNIDEGGHKMTQITQTVLVLIIQEGTEDRERGEMVRNQQDINKISSSLGRSSGILGSRSRVGVECSGRSRGGSVQRPQ